MRLVETKTYKIDIADAERINLCKLADKLDEIVHLFLGKIVYYIDCAGDECAIDTIDIEQVIEFLHALAEDRVEVY